MAVAAVLLQQFPEGRKPIAYASRTLNDQERKYSAYELEALAVLFAAEKFRMYVEHLQFVLETDNQALSWCLARPRKVGRLARWAVRLSAFKFVPKYIRGVDYFEADALSRIFDLSFASEDTCLLSTSAVLVDFPVLFQDLKAHQSQDPALLALIRRLVRKWAVIFLTKVCCTALPLLIRSRRSCFPRPWYPWSSGTITSMSMVPTWAYSRLSRRFVLPQDGR